MPRRSGRKVSLLYNRITLVVLIVAVSFMGVTIYGLFTKEREALSKRLEAQRELESIEERRVILEEDLAALATPRGREALVRDTFDVAREGEEVVVVLDALPATTTPKEEKKGFFNWIISIFD